MRYRIALAALLLGFASPASASQCPSLWQQISEKMKGAHTALSAEDQVKLTELRKQAEDFHHAGDHAKSTAALNKALALLG